MKKKTKITIWSCVAAVVAVLLAAAYAQHETMRRFYSFDGYANAVTMYDLKGDSLPANLVEIEDSYNKWENARLSLPEAPYFLHPVYRPPTGLAGGPFLLFIENRPPGSLLPFTMVVWANADGSQTRVESIANWNLNKTIEQDDDRRRASR